MSRNKEHRPNESAAEGGRPIGDAAEGGITSPSRLVTPNPLLGSIFPSSPEGFMCVEPPPPLTPLAIFSFLLPASLQLESLEPLCRSKFLSVSVKPGGGVTSPL